MSYGHVRIVDVHPLDKVIRRVSLWMDWSVMIVAEEDGLYPHNDTIWI